MKILVRKSVSERIKTAKDLNDFYAYCERDMESLELSYDWESQEDLERIENTIYDNVNYCYGVYDEENVKRILGVDELW